MQSRFESQEAQNALPRLDSYIRDLATPLPVEEQAEWRDEVRQHLDSLIAAHEELGLDHAAAVEAALRSFGDAKHIGREVAVQSAPATLLATEAKKSVGRFGGTLLPFVLLAFLSVFVYALPIGEAVAGVISSVGVHFLILCPFIGGWIVGQKTDHRLSPRQLAVVALIGAILTFPDSVLFSAMQTRFAEVHFEPAQLLWLPLSIGAACLARHHQIRRKQHAA